MLGGNVFGLIAPIATGYIVAATGSFSAAFIAAGLLALITGAPLGRLHLALMPVKDLLQLATQVVPYFSRHVSWHGHRTRLGPGTVLLPAGWHVPTLVLG